MRARASALLFNSFGFLFLYLPLVLGGFFLAGRVGARWAALWLALASLFFYGYWNVRYLPLLLASIAFNYRAARAILAGEGAMRKRRLAVALAANLALLGYFKYADFFLASAGAGPLGIVLPIGISFFTFTQVAFLVDCYQRKVSEYRFTHYLLFVSYFPHLVAGPLLHHSEMMPQFADPKSYRPAAANFAVGLSIFVAGLAKKVLIADNLAPLANPVFAAGAHPQLVEAWIGVLAYAFQLYFDFSGYSDMAIGLSRLFGVRLPLNFNAPYQAGDIAEFWRRWHMTLSRFLRDYLYIPLGGKERRNRNLMLTMLLGGLWHGAGWTFVAWGGLHGAYLVVCHAWRSWGRAHLHPAAARTLTFFAVMLAWVLFRADDFSIAFEVFGGLAGANGIALPHGLEPWAGWLPRGAGYSGLRWIEFAGLGLPALATAVALAFFAPTTQQLFRDYEPCFEGSLQSAPSRWPAWAPGWTWSLGFAALFAGCVFSMNRVTEFLYFQF